MTEGSYQLIVTEWFKQNEVLEYQSIFLWTVFRVFHLAPLLAFASEAFNVP